VARLVALGDAHLGRTHLAHLRDEQGRNLREEAFLRSFAWAVERTVQLEPDGFLWLGDVFDHARPTYRTFAHVLAGLQTLADAGLRGVAISGNHDTPRVRGTGSPYDALERVFANVTFAWRMESLAANETNLLIAHVALTSLPVRAYRDINELEIEEAAFDKGFDLVVLGHYHAFQKVSKRSWYAGSTDTFSFADSPEVPKGLVVIDTDAGTVKHVENPNTRPLVTVPVAAVGLSGGELVDAVEHAAVGVPPGAILRVYLNEVDPAALRQVANDQFQEAVPSAIYVQVEPDFGAEAMAVQGGPRIGSLEDEWTGYVEMQDLAGLDRDRVVSLGAAFLAGAKGETV
jgi:DNA repair exonuclease SbcCD nuclease subunit